MEVFVQYLCKVTEVIESSLERLDILVISGDHVSLSSFVLDEVHFTVNKIKLIQNSDKILRPGRGKRSGGLYFKELN